MRRHCYIVVFYYYCLLCKDFVFVFYTRHVLRNLREVLFRKAQQHNAHCRHQIKTSLNNKKCLALYEVLTKNFQRRLESEAEASAPVGIKMSLQFLLKKRNETSRLLNLKLLRYYKQTLSQHFVDSFQSWCGRALNLLVCKK